VIGPRPLTNSSERTSENEVIQKSSTLAYRAPEMCDLYSVNELTEAVDIWALGYLNKYICICDT
jgi:serine/threonine protein kinase